MVIKKKKLRESSPQSINEWKPYETDIQCAYFEYVRFHYPELPIFSNPNGAKVAHKKALDKSGKRIEISPERKKLVKEGLMSGVADVFISVARKGLHGLYLEFKRPGEEQRFSQKVFEKMVVKQGYGYLVVDDATKAFNITRKYIGDAK